MILELDTKVLQKIPNVTLSQFVFLTLVLDENQHTIKDVYSVVSRLKDTEIQELIDLNFITKESNGKKVAYYPTDGLKELFKDNTDYFDELLEIYPSIVVRPDGTKGFLKTNQKKCRLQYKKIIGKSKAKHEYIIDCLKKEVRDRIITGKLCYMKTMWRWLTNCEWEIYEYQANEEGEIYGTELF